MTSSKERAKRSDELIRIAEMFAFQRFKTDCSKRVAGGEVGLSELLKATLTVNGEPNDGHSALVFLCGRTGERVKLEQMKERATDALNDGRGEY
jgi:hypothetical protein